jgi:hypothetical protein
MMKMMQRRKEGSDLSVGNLDANPAHEQLFAFFLCLFGQSFVSSMLSLHWPKYGRWARVTPWKIAGKEYEQTPGGTLFKLYALVV